MDGTERVMRIADAAASLRSAREEHRQKIESLLPVGSRVTWHRSGGLQSGEVVSHPWGYGEQVVVENARTGSRYRISVSEVTAAWS